MCLGKNCGIGSSQALKELQVCMDFFACGNPFLVQASERANADLRVKKLWVQTCSLWQV